MRSNTKVILFSRATVGKTVSQHPVAVFNDDKQAKSYARLINTAHKSGNTAFAVMLDKDTVLTEDGALAPGIAFSLVSVAYNPVPGDSDDDLFGESKDSAE